ncbi:Metallo-dependent phosphatase-like protein [Gloeopeniophorella convolvens]|nr:Metallo-dependent phosphatase-like protein [Gloeopeniophorella convolvens]
MWVPRYSLRTLRFSCLAVVLWCEVGVFLAAGVRCSWPSPPPGEQQKATGDHGGPRATRVLVVADPQILDENSYPERGRVTSVLSQIFVDMYLRKAWRVAKGTGPDAVVFLGDMMDNGFANITMSKYQEYHARFLSIFSVPASLPVYYLPGNHDVGLGHTDDTSPFARSRYSAAFGPLSRHVVLGGHSLLMVDSPALVDEDWRRTEAREDRGSGLPHDLRDLQHLRAQHAADAPLILFSHIPLYRAPDADCGPLRERGSSIPIARGHGYQTVLSGPTSQLLLNEFRPALVFSGDDHDYCAHTHVLPDGRRVPEVTIKSLSIAMGIRQPGLQLLALAPGTRTHAHRPCALPDQLRMYMWVYAPLALAMLALVAVREAAAVPLRASHKREAKRSLELPAYGAPVQAPALTPSPPPRRRRAYPLRILWAAWAVAWPALALYSSVAVSVFW